MKSMKFCFQRFFFAFWVSEELLLFKVLRKSPYDLLLRLSFTSLVTTELNAPSGYRKISPRSLSGLTQGGAGVVAHI